MKIYICVILIILPYLLSAQSLERQVIGAGGQYVGSSYTLSYNVGEPTTETFMSTSNTLTQGFEQPLSTSTSVDVYSSVQKLMREGFNARLYPNPANNILILDITSLEERKYAFQLFTLLGQKIITLYQTYTYGAKSTYEIDIRALPAAPYFLTVIDNNMNILHTFKFTKTN